tara:strand:- start:327 stop:482 length:156 start_codon:yes stop_codon:yes gene_type:complete
MATKRGKKRSADKCWKGYKADGKKPSPSGRKDKNGKPLMVNNCVKIGKNKK